MGVKTLHYKIIDSYKSRDCYMYSHMYACFYMSYMYIMSNLSYFDYKYWYHLRFFFFFKYSVIYISILSSFVSNCVVLQKDILKYFFCILFTVHFSKKLITILLFIMSWLISLWMSLPSTYCIILLIKL